MISSHPVTALSSASRREVAERVATHYREASCAQKTLPLDRVVAMTGYARTYAIRLLNHPPQGKRTIQRPRQPRYGSQVQHALVFAWKAARQICAKRLVSFLPTCVAALEQHGHLQLTQENRSQLLRMSASTAERFLHSQRKPAPRSLSTTHAGPLLKHRIPLRTFHQWDNAQPGFLEADLVAHCGGHSQGCFLYTLTLTDVATGWTECLPILSKSPEAVLAAFQQARRLFPFPILGLDTDNGGAFINKKLLSYCEQEQITFSRGRPHLKDDQCFVEQKNGATVRQFVGWDRLEGYQASQQLRELYRALRLYVNCFQPSMKLVSKHDEGATVRRVYDPARTPLQRLLLSGILSTTAQQHLREVMQALDPLLLLHQLEHLQQAVWHCAHHTSPLSQSMPSASILHFSVEGCLEGPFFSDTSASVLQTLQDAPQSDRGLLDWPRTTRDPFEGAWEQILSWVLTHPEWSGGDLLQHVQRVFPGRSASSHLRTLQSGLRTIRTRVREIVEEPWPEEVIQASRLIPLTPEEDQQKAEPRTDPACSPTASAPRAHTGACVVLHQPTSEEEAMRLRVSASLVTNERTQPLDEKGSQPVQALHVQCLTMAIEGAIQASLQEQRNSGRSHKTMEWHQTSLGLLQQYLVSKRLCFLSQITERVVHDWVTFLRTTPSATGTLRRNSTIATYGRSARAFCHWLVRTGSLDQTPIPRGTMPKADTKSLCLIEPDQFDRLLLACHARGDGGSLVNQTTMRKGGDKPQSSRGKEPVTGAEENPEGGMRNDNA